MPTRARDASSHAPAGISVAAIVETALVVVAQRGVTGLTMAAVAERLGVRSPSLYHHVRDKNGLLALLARDAFGGFGADRDAFDRVQSVQEWIEATTTGTLRLRTFYAAHPGLAALVQATATTDRDRDDRSRAELVRAQIQALVRLGVPRRRAKDAFEACARWTMAAVAAEPGPGGAREDERLFQRGLDWLLTGLRLELEQQTRTRRPTG